MSVDDLSDHDMLRRIYTAIYEPETGLKDRLLRDTKAIWGNTTPGLMIRMQMREDDHRKVFQLTENMQGRLDDLGMEVGETKSQMQTVINRQNNPVLFTLTKKKAIAIAGVIVTALVGSQFLWDFIRTALNLPFHG